MLMTFGTPVVISKGYNDTPALKYSENNDSVRFRVGYKVYDTRAENNSRWLTSLRKRLVLSASELKI
jgi:single-strand DNA-binding protein